MATVRCFKMPFKSNHFNQNQKVWVVEQSGNQSAYCYGRYRGRGRYVRAWVSWGSASKPTPGFRDFDVDEGFAKRISGGEVNQ